MNITNNLSKFVSFPLSFVKRKFEFHPYIAAAGAAIGLLALYACYCRKEGRKEGRADDPLRKTQNSGLSVNASFRQLTNTSLNEMITERQLGISEVESLGGMDLSENRLTAIPKEMERFKWLQSLDLSYNKIISSPQGKYQFPNLQTLFLIGNELTEFPVEILDCVNLKYLDVSRNKIKSIPEKICDRLKRLDYFIVRNNELHELPEAWGDNVSSLHLDVSHNHIQTLPSSLAQFPQHCRILVKGNRISSQEYQRFNQLVATARANNQKLGPKICEISTFLA